MSVIFRSWLRRVHECGAKAALVVYAPTSKVGHNQCLCECVELQLAVMCGKTPSAMAPTLCLLEFICIAGR